MTETIYIVADMYGVRRMTKSLPSLKRGEIPVKVNVTIQKEAFRTPVIEKEIIVDDWREGIDIGDVDFKRAAITSTEAETIRKMRLEEMKRVLEEQGYEVSKVVTE